MALSPHDVCVYESAEKDDDADNDWVRLGRLAEQRTSQGGGTHNPEPGRAARLDHLGLGLRSDAYRHGQGNHGAPMSEARDGVRAGHHVEVTKDGIRADAEGEWDRAGPHPTARLATRSGDLHRVQLVAPDHQIVGLDGMAVFETLEEHVDELELVVGVEHVGEAVAIQRDPAGGPAVARVGDELDGRRRGRRDRGFGTPLRNEELLEPVITLVTWTGPLAAALVQTTHS
jgi:hypothetical protein